MSTLAVPQPKSSHHAAQVGLGALQIVLALFLGFAGVNKLRGDPQMVQLFGVIGFGQWFRYLTGLLEVIGAAGLLIPRLAPYAAALLTAVMLAAAATHWFILGGSGVLPLALAVAAGLVAWFRHRQTR